MHLQMHNMLSYIPLHIVYYSTLYFARVFKSVKASDSEIKIIAEFPQRITSENFHKYIYAYDIVAALANFE